MKITTAYDEDSGITTTSISDSTIPLGEVIAAFRHSFLTAEREGFARKATEVQGYIEKLESMRDSLPKNTFIETTIVFHTQGAAAQ